MARLINRLTDKEVRNKRKPGHFADGGGLWLQVTKSGAKSWIFRYSRGTNPNSINGHRKSYDMGLGSLHTISLADARSTATDYRKMLLNGLDPIKQRNQGRLKDAFESASSKTFDECAAAFVKAHKADWKNVKHAEQWENTLETYASPTIGKLPIQAIDTALVLNVIEPIWSEKTETASRLRGRIESVLNWATTRGYRKGDNPARWRGHLDNVLPNLRRRQHIEHHAALPYKLVGKLIHDLREQEGTAAEALEFTILTLARTSETIGAEPAEFDLGARTWNIPGARMKAHKPHRVPLSARALAIVSARIEKGGKFVFPGRDKDKPLSNMAMLKLLERMERGDITVHGFRSSFRDWAAECTNYPREVCEMALAHAIGSDVEAAYRRSDLFEKRRRLMNDWAKYCEQSEAGKVIPMRGKTSKS